VWPTPTRTPLWVADPAQGNGAATPAARHVGPKLADVARRAQVSTGTVSAVLNRTETVPEGTRIRVGAAMANLGYVLGARPAVTAPHWRRNGFATWLFQPAVTGWYPAKAPQPARPVPVLADPWPGVRGLGAQRACPGRLLVDAGRTRSDSARPAAHPQDADG